MTLLGATSARKESIAAARVYVSNAESKDICVLDMHPHTGALTGIERVAVRGTDAPSSTSLPMAVSPTRRFLHQTLRSPPLSRGIGPSTWTPAGWRGSGAGPPKPPSAASQSSRVVAFCAPPGAIRPALACTPSTRGWLARAARPLRAEDLHPVWVKIEPRGGRFLCKASRVNWRRTQMAAMAPGKGVLLPLQGRGESCVGRGVGTLVT